MWGIIMAEITNTNGNQMMGVAVSRQEKRQNERFFQIKSWLCSKWWFWKEIWLVHWAIDIQKIKTIV